MVATNAFECKLCFRLQDRKRASKKVRHELFSGNKDNERKVCPVVAGCNRAMKFSVCTKNSNANFFLFFAICLAEILLRFCAQTIFSFNFSPLPNRRKFLKAKEL